MYRVKGYTVVLNYASMYVYFFKIGIIDDQMIEKNVL